jgi:hypothetical protein
MSLELELDGILCVKERRRVARDNTVQYRQRNLQLFPDADRRSYAGAYVEIQDRMDGQILAYYKGKILTPQDAPPLAAKLRDKAKSYPNYPAIWRMPKRKRPRKARGKHQIRIYLGPLAGEGVWWEDPARRNIHSELTREGLERARLAGKQVHIHKVEDRKEFAEKFVQVIARLEKKAITRRQAAEELGICTITLKRVLDDYVAATQQAPVEYAGELTTDRIAEH